MAQPQTERPLDDPSSIDADQEYTHSLDVRNRVRDQLESDIAAFLAEGGSIEQVDDNVRADPPRRPETRYGRRAI